MKSLLRICLLFILSTSFSPAELSPEELLQAVDKMTPEQAYDFQEKLSTKLWDPVPEGFFTRLATDITVSYSSFDSIDLDSLSLSAGSMDIENVSGLNIGLLWRTFSERFRLGFRFGGWENSDSNLNDAGYSRAEIVGAEFSLVANYQWIRSNSWLLWTELAPGSGSIEIETIDTPTGDSTTLRHVDETYGQFIIQTGISTRLNSAITAYIAAGYRFAESLALQEGGQTSTVEIDASGFTAQLGLGFNF